MKMIIAHLPHEAWESVQSELHDLGVLNMTIAEVQSSTPRRMRVLRYRGATLATRLCREIRIECIAPAQDAQPVIDLLRAQAEMRPDSAGPVLVVDVEDLYGPASADVFPEDPRLQIGAR